MKKTFSWLLAGLGLIGVLGLAFVSWAQFTGRPLNFDFRNQATGEQLEVVLTNSSTKINPGQAFTVDLSVNTKGKFISGLRFGGTFWLNIRDSMIDRDKSGLIINQLTGISPVLSQIFKDKDGLSFQFFELATPGTPFTTHNQLQKIASFNLYPVKSGKFDLTIDTSSGAQEFEKAFLPTSTTQKTYDIEITTPGTGGTSTAPADAGIHRGCNEYCADSRECATEFSCWYNRCRNPKNITEERCTNPVVVTQPAATTRPRATATKGTVVPAPTPLTAVATVIISTVQPSPTPSTAAARVASPSPTLSPRPTATPTVRNLGASPTPSPTPAATTQNSSLPLLIGAAVVTGLVGLFAIIFFLKNRNSNYQQP